MDHLIVVVFLLIVIVFAYFKKDKKTQLTAVIILLLTVWLRGATISMSQRGFNFDHNNNPVYVEGYMKGARDVISIRGEDSIYDGATFLVIILLCYRGFKS